MPKLLKPLTKREINKLPDGRFAVGGTAGLYVEKSNGKIVCWILRDRIKGRHQYYPGFLALDAVRLKSAKDKASLFLGIDPSGEKRALKKKQRDEKKSRRENEKRPTLKQIYSWWVLNEKKNGRWAKGTRAEHYHKLMACKYFLDAYGDKNLFELTEEDVTNAILVSYGAGVRMGQRFFSFLKIFFSYCMLHPEYGFERPLITPVLELKVKELNRINKKPRLNRACPPFEFMPELMKLLFSIQKTWAHLFIFEILTASRQEAVRGLRWKDLDFEKKLWVISIETDKVGSQDPNKRTIVLSDKAIEYLETLPRGKDEDLVFPYDYLITGETVPFKETNLWRSFSRYCIKRIAEGAKGLQTEDGRYFSPHATSRSTFKTWSRSELDDNYKRFDPQSVEHCLLHYRDAYRGAYDRSNLISHRKFIMDKWAKFLLQKVDL